MEMLRRMMLLFLGVSAAGGLWGGEYAVNGRVDRVTVFPSAARVVREAGLTLPAGEHVIVFRQLPRRVRRSTVRGLASGTGGVTILDTRVKRVYGKKRVSPAAAALKKRIKALEKRLQGISRSQSLIRMRLSFLKSLRISSIEDINKKIKVRDIKTEDWERLYTFIFGKVTALTIQNSVLRDKYSDLDKKKTDLEGRLSNLEGGGVKRFTTARVMIKTARRGRVRVTLEYEVYGVYWRPLYEVRLSGKDNNARVMYSASIRQRSGEDWIGARLKLSTAAASRWKRLPILRPWYLTRWYRSYYKRKRYSRGFAGGARDGSKMSRPSAGTKGFAKDREKFLPGKFSFASVQRGSVAVVFDVPGRTTIKSGRESVQKVLVQKMLPVTLAFRGYPVYSGKAFVEGTVKNTTGLYFLNGSVRVFRDGIQIGKTSIGKVAAGETFKLFFGNDPRITVKKEQLERKMDPGSDNELYYTFRLTVQNNRKVRSKVVLTDMLPVSTNTKIEVDVKKMSVKPFKKTKRGIYSWRFDLAPGEKKTVVYKLKVEYPSKWIIRGLK